MRWKSFLVEINKACRKKKVSFAKLKKWIQESIPNIEKETSIFLVSLGPTPTFPNLLLDIHILTDSILHEFSIYKRKQRHYIYNMKKLSSIRDTRTDGYVTFDFMSDTGDLFAIEIDEKELKTLNEFVQAVLKIIG